MVRGFGGWLQGTKSPNFINWVVAQLQSMRRLLLISLVVVASVCGAAAKEVGSERALSIAAELFGDTTRGGGVELRWDSDDLLSTRGEGGAPTFYVITPSSGAGFVIVAGDDAVRPILGYSTTYNIASVESLPSNFEGWLKYIDTTVRKVRREDGVASDAVAQLWSEVYKPVGAVMLNTARWSQLAPYYNECPMDGGSHSLTGCTQTAMAIIMYHHRWPERVQGITEPYTTTKGIYVPARDLNHAYDWDAMLDTYTDGNYTDAQGAAVAVLMADLGHAFKAEYTAVDTGAFPDMLALYEKFGYSPASNIVVRRNYSSADWVAMLRHEIEASRPLFYAGYTSEGAGHAFVLDGVDANNLFHVNWGWGGRCDGFFAVDNLTLDKYLFDTQHWAVMGMHPMREGEIDNWLYLTSTGLKASTTTFERGVQFEISPVSVANYSQLNFNGEVRAAHCNAKGEIKSWIADAQRLELPSLYGGSCDRMKAVVTDDIAEGDRVVLFYRSDSSQKWFKIDAFADSTCAEIVMKHAPIGSKTSMSFDKSSGELVVEYEADVKSALYLSGEYVENGVTISRGVMRLDTNQLQRGATYAIYLERKGVESKSIMFTLNSL